MKSCAACRKGKRKCDVAEVQYAAEHGAGEVAGASGSGIAALKDRMTKLEKKTTKIRQDLQKDIDEVYEQANTAQAAANTVFDSHKKLKSSVAARFRRVNERLDDHDNWLGELQYTQRAQVDRVERAAETIDKLGSVVGAMATGTRYVPIAPRGTAWLDQMAAELGDDVEEVQEDEEDELDETFVCDEEEWARLGERDELDNEVERQRLAAATVPGAVPGGPLPFDEAYEDDTESEEDEEEDKEEAVEEEEAGGREEFEFEEEQEDGEEGGE